MDVNSLTPETFNAYLEDLGAALWATSDETKTLISVRYLDTLAVTQWNWDNELVSTFFWGVVNPNVFGLSEGPLEVSTVKELFDGMGVPYPEKESDA